MVQITHRAWTIQFAMTAPIYGPLHLSPIKKVCCMLWMHIKQFLRDVCHQQSAQRSLQKILVCRISKKKKFNAIETWPSWVLTGKKFLLICLLQVFVLKEIKTSTHLFISRLDAPSEIEKCIGDNKSLSCEALLTFCKYLYCLTAIL